MTNPKLPSVPAAPGTTIGILGGGQLGRMLSLAAAQLGFKTHIYSDEADAPALQVATAVTCGRFDDREALTKFACTCQAITFEFENVPADALELVARVARANPSARTLRLTQDRYEEKQFITALGLATPRHFPVDNVVQARMAFAELGAKRAVLKTRRLGYDGKGQSMVDSSRAAAAAIESFKGATAILEEFVAFEYEASVVAARGEDGIFAAYDPPENVHGDHILRRSIVPSRMSEAQCQQAKEITKKIADALGYVGVLAVEFFVKSDGGLIVNEIAPRVHNSGHWTLEACAVSQFEQHIRAVAGWPLGDPVRHSNAVMENIIGDEAADWKQLSARGGGLHLYGKNEMRKGRKMGHITTIFPVTTT